MKFSKIVAAALAIMFLATLLIFPKESSKGVSEALLYCGSVVIPSLFPITFICLFIMELLKDKFYNAQYLIIFIFSLLGGYIVGAKLIEEAFVKGNISKKSADILRCFCLNGGIGFIIIAVGSLIFNSQKIGIILYICHIFYSVLGFIIFYKKLKKPKKVISRKNQEKLSEIFCLTAQNTCDTVIKICGFVIIFSVVNAIFQKLGIPFYFSMFFEITTSLKSVKNIFVAAFLLGFGGISVIFQVISVSKKSGVNLKILLPSLFIHGVFSAVLTYYTVKISGISAPAFSSGIETVYQMAKTKASLSLSLVLMVILFIISAEGKNKGGNLRDDLLQ